jgi:hypothetical protein
VTRFLLQISLAATLLFLTVQLLICAQPYDDTDLRTFLTPADGCPIPCFMGIRPGITTGAEAVLILESHPWVRTIDVRFDTDSREGQLVWTWSGSQPPQIRAEIEGVLRICDSLICGLSIPTRVEYGAILLEFGQPDSGTLRSILSATHTVVAHTAIYDRFQLNVRVNGLCPPLFTAMALQHGLTTLQMGILGEQISISRLHAANFQVINFQKQAVAWLRRREYVCLT